MSYLAEQNVIGALLLDKDSIGEVTETLTANMFTDEMLGKMYSEFQMGYDRGYPVNAVTLSQRLAVGDFPQALINQIISECMQNTVTSAGIKDYAGMVVSEYKARVADKIITDTKFNPVGVEGQIGKLITRLEELQEHKSAKAKTLAEITIENKDRYFKDSKVPKINIGFRALDELLGGLEGGDVIAIGARPAVGKSAFVTQIAANIAKNGKRIGFFNLEMSQSQVYERFLVNQSGLRLTRVRRAVNFLDDEKEKFDKANGQLEQIDNLVITSGGKSISEIRNESRHMNYDIIIIDYLQLVKADTTYRGNRTAEVGAISKAVKALAMELNIPIIILSQLNRVSESKDTKEPTMAEFREAGDIEQDASIVILLWNLNEERTAKGCKVDKNRQGLAGKMVLRFDGDRMRFVETREKIEDVTGWKDTGVKNDCPFE